MINECKTFVNENSWQIEQFDEVNCESKLSCESKIAGIHIDFRYILVGKIGRYLREARENKADKLLVSLPRNDFYNIDHLA